MMYQHWIDAMDAEPLVATPAKSAPEVLQQAAKHMADRAATYDSPSGERSMAQTVAAFNAHTGHCLTESEGWLFMVNLKIVRDRQRNAAHRDSCEDMVAYSALYAESRFSEELHPLSSTSFCKQATS